MTLVSGSDDVLKYYLSKVFVLVMTEVCFVKLIKNLLSSEEQGERVGSLNSHHVHFQFK